MHLRFERKIGLSTRPEGVKKKGTPYTEHCHMRSVTPLYTALEARWRLILTNRILFSHAKWAREELCHHASRVPRSCLGCYSSATLPRGNEVYYKHQSSCVEMDTQPRWYNGQAHTMVSTCYGIGHWSNLESRCEAAGCARVIANFKQWKIR